MAVLPMISVYEEIPRSGETALKPLVPSIVNKERCAPLTLTASASSDNRPIRFPISSRGRYLSVDIASEGATPLTINSLALVYSPDPRIR